MIERIDISASHLELTEDLKKYVNKKIGKLDKYMSRHVRKSVHADVKLKEEPSKKSDKFTAEVILHLPQETMTAKDSTLNIFAAVDIVEAKLKNQLRKYKEKTADHKADRKGALEKVRRKSDKDFWGFSELMNLFLTSYRVPNTDSLEDFFEKSLKDINLAIVPNAKDYYAPRARSYKLNETQEYFKNLDVSSSIVDLKDFDNAEALVDELGKYDGVWVMGGNTYCLMHEIKRSGFDDAIRQLTNEGYRYAGESAGALVAGNRIDGVEAADIPEFSEKVYKEGIGLVDYYVLPHVDNVAFNDAVVAARDIQKDNNIIEIEDEQIAIFKGDEYKII